MSRLELLPPETTPPGAAMTEAEGLHRQLLAETPSGQVILEKQRLGEYGTHEELFDEVRTFIEDHVNLGEDAEYDVLTSYVFETWRSPSLDEIGYLLFVGQPGSGKSRALETMSALCYNPFMAAYTTASCIFRKLDEGPATLILDELQQYLKEDAPTLLAILNAGQRRGAKALISVPEGKDWVPREFEVFGPKILASTENIMKSLASRCIAIPMIKTRSVLPLKVDQSRGKALKHKLEKWERDTRAHPIDDAEKILRGNGLTDPRNITTFLNLVALAPEETRQRIIKFAKEIDDSLLEEDGLSFQSEIFKAVAEAYKTAKNSIISVDAVAQAYNNQHEGEDLTNRYIGAQLNLLGINHVKRIIGGKTGRVLPLNLFKRLAKRYNVEGIECIEDRGSKLVSSTLDRVGAEAVEVAPVSTLPSTPSTPSTITEPIRNRGIAEKLEFILGLFIPSHPGLTTAEAAGLLGVPEAEAEKLLKVLERDGSVFQALGGVWRRA